MNTLYASLAAIGIMGTTAVTTPCLAIMPLKLEAPRLMVSGRDVMKEFDDKFNELESKFNDNVAKNNARFKDAAEKQQHDLESNYKRDEAWAIRDNVIKRIEYRDYAGAAEAAMTKKMSSRIKTIAAAWERSHNGFVKDYEAGQKKLETDMLRRIDILIPMETKSGNTANAEELRQLRTYIFAKPTKEDLEAYQVTHLKPHDRVRYYTLDRHNNNVRTDGNWLLWYWQLHGPWITGCKEATAIEIKGNDIFLAKRGNGEFTNAGIWKAADGVLKLEWTAFKANGGKSVIESFSFPAKEMTLTGKTADGTPLTYKRDFSDAPFNTNLELTRYLTEHDWMLTSASIRTTTPFIKFASDGTGLIKDCRNKSPKDYENCVFFRWKIRSLGKLEISTPFYEPLGTIDFFDNTIKLTYREYLPDNRGIRKKEEIYALYSKPHGSTGAEPEPTEIKNDSKFGSETKPRYTPKPASKPSFPDKPADGDSTTNDTKKIKPPKEPVKIDDGAFDF